VDRRAAFGRPPAGFAGTVFALLGLGIAANTALFSVVDTVRLKLLPYPNPNSDRLISIEETSSAKSQKTSLIAPGRIEDWNRLSRMLTAVSGVYSESVTDTGGGDPERLTGVRVAPRYVEVFGVPALLVGPPRPRSPRVSAEVLTAFALMAMGLAAVGLYSLVM
jgi:hypothetical protein